jgi:GR25 family glycosyltransferase involved in LPS biosynthesis
VRIQLDNIQFWYINLASRPDRDQHAREQFARHGLPVRRFEAFTPAEWPGPPEAVERMRPTPGAIGCYQSQVHVTRTVQGSDRIVGVCEDDVLFCDDLVERFAYIEEHFDFDWDVFWLGSTYHINPAVWHKETLGRDFEQTSVKHIHRAYGLWGTYAYLVNGRSVRKILELFEANVHRARGIDDLYIMLEPQLNTYCFTPGMAFQIDGLSNIGMPPGSTTVFSHFHKLGRYVFSKRLADFDYDSFDWAEGRRVSG